MRLNGAEILIRSLIDHGVDTVFGYPGGQVIDIYNALYHKRGIRHIMTAHEQGACHAADGYARATGKVGVVIATSGPGATNLVTGIATAFLDSVPLIAITGNVDTKMMGKDSFQEVDITGITMPITKYNYIVKDVHNLEEVVNDAFVVAMSGRPGPVLIDIPKDVQQARCEYKGDKIAYELPIERDYSDMDTILELLNDAKRPCFYIGGGVVSSGSGQKVLELAKSVDAPIVSSMMGLGAIDSDEKYFLGMAGMHGTYAANMAVHESDVLVAIGSRFSDRATGDKSDYHNKKNIVHIDIDPAEIDKNITSDYHIVGDIREIIDIIDERVLKMERPTWMKLINSYTSSDVNANHMQGDFTPEYVIKAVNSKMNADDIVATDVGQHQMWTASYYKFKTNRTFLTSGGLGTMGFGLGASIGASIGTHKRTVLFTSDGSFHMNMNELATISSEHLPVLVVVLDNRALGMVKQWQHLFYKDRYSSTTIERKTDYAMLANAMGIDGYNVATRDELDKALSKVFRSKAPALISCKISSEEMVLPMIPPNSNTKHMLLRDKKIK